MLDECVRYGVKEQDRRGSENNWRETFLQYLNNSQFGKAREYVEKRGIPRPLVCHAAYDVFMSFYHKGRIESCLRMAREFEDYRFGNWLPAETRAKPQIYKSQRK